MKRLPVIVLLLVVASCATVPAWEQAISQSTTQLQTVASESAVPGLAVAVSVGDRIAWMESFGVSDLETKVPLRADTAFRIGSVSKILTVTALMRLVEDGKIELDHPVSRYLPDFPHGSITIRQLSGHLGGIRHYGRGEFMNREHYATVPASLARFAKDPLVAAPGTKYSYTSYGYNVLGAVMEKAAGRSFEELVRAEVLVPLGMTDTFIDPGAGRPNSGFFLKSDAGTAEVAPVVDLSDRIPAGGYLASARDLARLGVGTTSPRFLSDASREVMFTKQRLADGTEAIAGIGWRIATDSEGRTFVHHGGEAMGGRAFILVYPKERVTVAIVSNVSGTPVGTEVAGAIARRFLEEGETR